MAATNAQRLVRAARRQVGVTLSYDPAYSVLRFPNGDVDRAKGVCTDVVIRAFRDALGADLQALVNADMRANFGRSEEHTSELQSLMRISYAVFCLKKKKKNSQ